MIDSLAVAKRYAEGVINEEILVCKDVKLACQKFLNELDNPKYYYDSQQIDHICDFISELPLTDGYTGNFILQDWQIFFISSSLGIKIKESGLRKYEKLLLSVPRKNAKSQLIAAITLYFMIFESDQEIIAAANTTEQVSKVTAKKINAYINYLGSKNFKRRYNDIQFPARNNYLYIVSGTAKTRDGHNVSLGLLDEIEEAKDSKMYDVIRSSQVSRAEPLIICTMTGGFDKTSFAYQLKEYAQKVLQGDVEDTTQYSLMFGLDAEDPEDYWLTEEAILKANPNAGISVKIDFIKNEVKGSLHNPIVSHSVKVKHFNHFADTKNAELSFIEDEYVVKAMKPLDFPTCKELYLSLDLASTRDLTVLTVLWFDEDEIMNFKNINYLPEFNTNQPINKERFSRWAEQGYIKMTEGNVTDYSLIEEDIHKLAENNDIITVYYDVWNSAQLVSNIYAKGIHCKQIGQGISSLSAPTKELQRQLLMEHIYIDENPVTRWCFSNAIIKPSEEGNFKMKKKSEGFKIDGANNIATCLAGYLSQPVPDHNIYV